MRSTWFSNLFTRSDHQERAFMKLKWMDVFKDACFDLASNSAATQRNGMSRVLDSLDKHMRH